MISYLSGKIIVKDEKFVIINAGGVGYKVFISSKRFKDLLEIGESCELFCRTRVLKDRIEIYGTFSSKELDLFESLMSISGVGPKAALEISAFSSVDKLKEVIESEDEEALKDLFGIGKKKAQSIIFEYSRKIMSARKEEHDKDEVDALLRLGFSRKEAASALASLPKNITSTELRIKEALKNLGTKS